MIAFYTTGRSQVQLRSPCPSVQRYRVSPSRKSRRSRGLSTVRGWPLPRGAKRTTPLGRFARPYRSLRYLVVACRIRFWHPGACLHLVPAVTVPNENLFIGCQEQARVRRASPRSASLRDFLYKQLRTRDEHPRRVPFKNVSGRPALGDFTTTDYGARRAFLQERGTAPLDSD